MCAQKTSRSKLQILWGHSIWATPALWAFRFQFPVFNICSFQRVLWGLMTLLFSRCSASAAFTDSWAVWTPHPVKKRLIQMMSCLLRSRFCSFANSRRSVRVWNATEEERRRWLGVCVCESGVCSECAALVSILESWPHWCGFWGGPYTHTHTHTFSSLVTQPDFIALY